MRASYTIKNAIVAMIMNLITILVGFVAQKIFIQVLGTEYLGINGLFSNMISMLSIVELGLGSAIIYNLYKPIYENDKSKIQSLMLFYKSSYRKIAIIVAIIGLAIIPFLGSIVGTVSIKESIVLIYLLFLMDTVASYLLTYKRSILYADQKTYITNIVHIGYIIVMNIFQIIILYITKNYILYLLIKIIFRILENLVITIIANKKYPYITEKDIKEIDKNTRKGIYTKVKGLLVHKIGGIVVLGTDNIIISKFLGVTTVGLYSNYNLIIQALTNLFTQVFNSITASVGNLLVEKNASKSYKIYKNMIFANSWMYTFASTGLLCVIEPFIKVWIGEQFLLPRTVLIVLVINFYMQGMRKTSTAFKEAAGIYYEDRYVPILESVINIVASVILVNILGLEGVFLGTIISTFILFFYSFPKFVYKPLFERTYYEYLIDYIPYVIITIISIVCTNLLISNIIIENVFIQIIINGIFVCIIPNLIYLLTFIKSEELKYYFNLIKGFWIKNRK